MAIRITLVLAVFCFNLNLLNCNYQFRDELASNPDLYPYHENHESQQNNDKDIIKVENLLQSHHWDTWNPKVESIEKYLEKELKELPMNAEIIENRSKKNKNYDSNSEAKPLKDHRRKGGDEFHDQANNESPAPNKLTCSSKFDTQKNMMIDSKASVKNGASLISVEKIPPKEDLKLTELEKSCMKLCCETDECDSSILSLKLGDEGYRCYLFKCNGNCFYIKHDDYIVSRMKSQEEIEGNKVKGDDSDLVITTGHRPENLKTCNQNYEFTCVHSKMCIAIYDVCDNIDHCDDKSDETHCDSITNKESLSANEKGKQLYDLHKSKDKIENVKVNVLKEKDNVETKIENILKKPEKDSSEFNSEDIEKLKLMKQQSLIMDHLQELEDEFIKSNTNKNKYNPIKDLKSFIDEEEKYERKGYKDPFSDLLINSLDNDANEDSGFNFKKNLSPKKPKDLYKTTPKPKINFHDDHSNENSQNFIKVENYAPEDKPYFYDKSKATTSSANVTMAILVLILGISLILSFFAYLFASTKYFRRRIKWLNFNNKESKNLDVDGDYLINGMYL